MKKLLYRFPYTTGLAIGVGFFIAAWIAHQAGAAQDTVTSLAWLGLGFLLGGGWIAKWSK